MWLFVGVDGWLGVVVFWCGCLLVWMGEWVGGWVWCEYLLVWVGRVINLFGVLRV